MTLRRNRCPRQRLPRLNEAPACREAASHDGIFNSAAIARLDLSTFESLIFCGKTRAKVITEPGGRWFVGVRPALSGKAHSCQSVRAARSHLGTAPKPALKRALKNRRPEPRSNRHQNNASTIIPSPTMLTSQTPVRTKVMPA